MRERQTSEAHGARSGCPALARGLSFLGRKGTHQAENLMAVVAAERLADHLARQNLVVVEGPSAPDHAGTGPERSAGDGSGS